MILLRLGFGLQLHKYGLAEVLTCTSACSLGFIDEHTEKQLLWSS